MTIKFNPSEYKSNKELTKEEKQNFEPVESGKGFALNTVEKNPEVARRLAIIENQAIDTLQKEIEISGLSFDTLLLEYCAAAEKCDFIKEKEISELLKQISDYDILRGGDYNKELKEKFKEYNEPLTYSEKTQDVLIKGIDKSDLDIGVKLLTDERFSLKTELLGKIGYNDDLLKRLYELTQDNLDIVDLIVAALKNPDTKVEILKDVFRVIIESQKWEKTRDKSFYSMRQHIAKVLVSKGEYSSILKLIDEECMETMDLRDLFHKIDSDQFLYDIASKSKSGNEVKYLFKFIADKDIFSKIIENKGQSLAGLSETEKQDKVELAITFFNALSKSPEIHQIGNLKKSNKFIVGISYENDTLFIAWSNTDEHEHHKYIFESLSQSSGQEFLDNFKSGGRVELLQRKENQFRVVFSGSSANFGKYGHRVLKLFKEDILKTLRDKLKSQDVELKIEISS